MQQQQQPAQQTTHQQQQVVEQQPQATSAADLINNLLSKRSREEDESELLKSLAGLSADRATASRLNKGKKARVTITPSANQSSFLHSTSIFGALDVPPAYSKKMNLDAVALPLWLFTDAAIRAANSSSSKLFEALNKPAFKGDFLLDLTLPPEERETAAHRFAKLVTSSEHGAKGTPEELQLEYQAWVQHDAIVVEESRNGSRFEKGIARIYDALIRRIVFSGEGDFGIGVKDPSTWSKATSLAAAMYSRERDPDINEPNVFANWHPNAESFLGLWLNPLPSHLFRPSTASTSSSNSSFRPSSSSFRTPFAPSASSNGRSVGPCFQCTGPHPLANCPQGRPGTFFAGRQLYVVSFPFPACLRRAKRRRRNVAKTRSRRPVR